MQIIFFCIIVVILNLAFYKKITSYKNMFLIPSCIGLFLATIFQILNYFEIGFLDPFFIIAASVQFFLSFLFGTIVCFFILKFKHIKRT
jgi:hypothetical protein